MYTIVPTLVLAYLLIVFFLRLLSPLLKPMRRLLKRISLLRGSPNRANGGKISGRGLSYAAVRWVILWLVMAGVGLSAFFRNWSAVPPTATPAAGSSPTPVAVGWWCRGEFVRVNDYIEVCVVGGSGASQK